MGYETTVVGFVVVKDGMKEKLLEDIEKARKKLEQGDDNYLTRHIAGTTIEEAYWTTIHFPETDRWYDLDKYVEWLDLYAESGELFWRGEEFFDIGGYEWEEGERRYVYALIRRNLDGEEIFLSGEKNVGV